MGNLMGKVALITGAGTKYGIGRAIALRLAKDGADIAVTDIPVTPEFPAAKEREEQEKQEGWRGLDSLVEEVTAMGRRAFAITADLSDSQQIEEMVTKVLAKFGKIDILVNNAALTGGTVGRDTSVVEFDEAVWRKQIAVNLTAPFLICKLVAKNMIERGEGGKIVNMSSIYGKKGGGTTAGYAASKFGIIGLTQNLAADLGPYKINVNAVCPASILTLAGRGPAFRQAIKAGATREEAIEQAFADRISETPLRRVGTPEEVANLVAFLVSSEADFITGEAININGGAFMD